MIRKLCPPTPLNQIFAQLHHLNYNNFLAIFFSDWKNHIYIVIYPLTLVRCPLISEKKKLFFHFPDIYKIFDKIDIIFPGIAI